MQQVTLFKGADVLSGNEVDALIPRSVQLRQSFKALVLLGAQVWKVFFD